MAPKTPPKRQMKLSDKVASAQPLVDEDYSTAEMETYATIARVQEQLGSEEGRVILRRRDEKGRMAALGTFPAADFTIDQVIQDFGGGRYDATFWKGSENLGTVTITVDEAIPRRIPKALEEKEETPVPVPGAPVPYGMNPELVALREVMSRQADLVNQLIVQMATREQPERTSMEDLIRVVTLMKGEGGADKVLDFVKQGIEIGKAAQSSGGDAGYWPVVEKFADPVAKVLNQALDREKGAAVPRALPAPAPVPAPGGGSVPTGAPAWLVHLQPHLPAILSWARAGKDPNLYAAVIVDNLPVGAQMEVAEAAKDPMFVDKTLAVLPMFKAYSVWARQVLEAMKQVLLAEEEGDQPDSNEGTGMEEVE